MNFFTENKTNWRYILIILALAILFGGGILVWQHFGVPKEEVEKPGGKTPEITKTGRVYVFGNEPFTELGLEVEGEETYCLIGPLKDELWNLQNTTLTIKGNIDEEYFCRGEGKTINVISYSQLKNRKKEFTFSTGCTDIADLWTNLPQDEKIEECNKILNQQTADLKNLGFKSEDCEVIEAEAKRCTEMLGTQLVCTYSCEK